METTEKIQKITSKGQITLPISWRRLHNISTIVVKNRGNTLEISPAIIKKDEDDFYTVFDALCDNKGKGIKAKDISTMLRKIDK